MHRRRRSNPGLIGRIVRATARQAAGGVRHLASGAWYEASGRADRDALARHRGGGGRKGTTRTLPAAERRAIAAETAAAKRERHADTMRELREQRAATALAVQAERLREAAFRARLAEDRARSAETRRSARGKAETAERRAGEMEEMGRKAERGELSSDQLRYFVNTYGRRGKS